MTLLVLFIRTTRSNTHSVFPNTCHTEALLQRSGRSASGAGGAANRHPDVRHSASCISANER